ncbi:hypothetical protein [Acetobacter cibinongensis]|uniref:Uncharacterized protein n=1 Tax=Acetobacter cibinongensis TaxID=146475 RepID=A0A1Z5YXY7_9PROT|nr:hypothetical protein [Acetobacter cibinongensis]OUJ04208.1 hypothetical protein HK14_14035 [Acetobacter cibinongensis]
MPRYLTKAPAAAPLAVLHCLTTIDDYGSRHHLVAQCPYVRSAGVLDTPLHRALLRTAHGAPPHECEKDQIQGRAGRVLVRWP